MSKIIMGIELKDRAVNAPKFQELLTKHGCAINTRLGLHNASDQSCSPRGLILLEFIEGADEEARDLEEELSVFPNAVVRKMVF